MKCIFFIILGGFLYSTAQTTPCKVQYSGEMKNVMWKGQLGGTIQPDTIAPKAGTYGVGPLEGLRGELLLTDGDLWQSTVTGPDTMKVEKAPGAKAPFFVYSKCTDWKALKVPDNARDLPELEHFLDSLAKNMDVPFVFRIKGTVNIATIHVVNLAPGSKVSSPEDAHKGQESYLIFNEPSEIVGFFSRHHQSVFTHHSTYMHLHLITDNKKMMGHLDRLFLANDATLYVPANLTN